jgi:predicted transcriptional regulator
MAEYISIKEFSKMAKITPQSIYKRLKKEDNPLNNFVKLVDGNKLISTEALKLYQKPVPESTEAPAKEQQKQELQSNEVNEDLLETLRKQLEEKDKQIEKLEKLLDQEQQLHLKSMHELDVVREEKRALLEDKSKSETSEEGNGFRAVGFGFYRRK